MRDVPCDQGPKFDCKTVIVHSIQNLIKSIELVNIEYHSQDMAKQEGSANSKQDVSLFGRLGF